MNIFLNKFHNVLVKIIIYLSIVFFSILAFSSLLITAYYPNNNENVAYNFSNSIPVVICSIITVIIIYLLIRYHILEHVSLNNVVWILSVYILVASIAWALLANVWPEFDSKDLINAASELGINYDANWAPGWYMERFPYQLPYVLLIRGLQYIFGSSQIYVVLEFLNAICASATAALTVFYTKLLFNDYAAKITSLVLFFFMPLILFTTLAYGNIPSMPFLMAALIFQLLYFKTRKFIYNIAAAIMITLSILLKSTMLVALLAMIVLWIVDSFRSKRIKNIIAIILSLLLYTVSLHGLNYVISNKYDVNLENGLPKTAWIAMGLQDEKNYTNPGWYNGYIWNWQDNYDPDIANKDSIESIKKSLSHFVNDPQYALSFTLRKQASIWLDPTYETILNSNWHSVNGSSMCTRPMTRFVNSIYNGKLNIVITIICDVVQFITLFASVIAFIYLRKRDDIYLYGGLITCLGFGVLYLIWEAKAQYSFPVYVLLLVYAGYGLQMLSEFLNKQHNSIVFLK